MVSGLGGWSQPASWEGQVGFWSLFPAGMVLGPVGEEVTEGDNRGPELGLPGLEWARR